MNHNGHDDIARSVERWVRDVVVGHNLCPFAGRELATGRIRVTVSDAKTPEHLISDLQRELRRLVEDQAVETTVLAHPRVLSDFVDYNQFLDAADGLLIHMDLADDFQIASFHPDYRFADSDDDDPANYTNRSPCPLLHLLREASLSNAIDGYGDTAAISERNIALFEELGLAGAQALLAKCKEP